MMKIRGASYLLVLFLICLSFCFSNAQNTTATCAKGKYPPDAKTKVGWYIVDLDLPPEQRWTQIAKELGPQIQHLIDGLKDFIGEWGAASKMIIKLIDSSGSLDNTLPYPFAAEIKGLADASGINLGEMLLYNLFYEFFSICTSIVAEDTNGDMYHGRNLDFGLFLGWNSTDREWMITERLRPLIVNLDWRRNNQTVFKSVNFAGYTGILTAIKPKIFTMTMNERFNIRGGFIGIIKWILGNHNQHWMGFLTRDVMENATSFTQAVSKLNNTVMLASAYFIVGGNKSGEAVVITRDPGKAVDVWPMRKASGWYILETNYDHWKAPLFLDDRRTAAHKCMDQTGQKNTSFNGIFNVLSSQPVLNKLTTYSALMHVADGTLETYIQFCGDPCMPW